jgi:hypothetical protein
MKNNRDEDSAVATQAGKELAPQVGLESAGKRIFNNMQVSG